MSSPVDRMASRLMQEVVDAAPASPAWSDVVARVTTEPSAVHRPARHRPRLAVGLAAGVAAAAGLGVVVYERPGRNPSDVVIGHTAPELSTPVASTSTSTENDHPRDVAFAPRSLPHGFRAVEASTWNGPQPGQLPLVSAQTWISRGTDGEIVDVVRLSANRLPEPPPNLVPAEPTGLTVHGHRAEPIPSAGGGLTNAISWQEHGLSLHVSTSSADALAIAERSTVSATDGITLPVGTLGDSFSLIATHPGASLADGLSSSLTLIGDGGAQLVLTATPNVRGETAESLGTTPGSQPRHVGRREVWVSTADAGHASARWIDGDHVLSAGGDVDEATLLAFVSSVEAATPAEYAPLLAQVSAEHQRVPERDRAVFADGLAVSMHSDADPTTSEQSSFGPRSFCVTGDRMVCTGEPIPTTVLGLLTRLTSTQTINGERELLVWTRRGPAVTRVYDADTRAELEFQTAAGAGGEFTRVRAPSGVVDIAVEMQIAGEPFFRTEYLDVGVMDPYANVDAPVPQPG